MVLIDAEFESELLDDVVLITVLTVEVYGAVAVAVGDGEV